jgi:pyruvate/2-oxoglutarate dehydrogenase complex dihydrolipoamide dehydrogenase (E3) component
MREAFPGVRPDSGDDQRLLANVHPAEWVNPTPAARYHLVVIGAGTAGLVTAAGAAGLGARVALIERSLMGGDCLNTGCVPSKAMLAGTRQGGEFSEVMARMRRLRADISPADSAERFRGLGVDVFFGGAQFTAPDLIRVAGAELRFRRAVIATGAAPVLPVIPGLADAGPLTSETIFGLVEPPRRLLILGGGAIGCELAQAFVGLGVAVTLVEQEPRVLPREDPDAAAVIRRALERRGVTLKLGARVERVSRDAGATRLHLAGGAEAVEGDTLLAATGRLPRLEGLGLDAAGIRVKDRRLLVNDRLRTANSRVYAVGDVVATEQFTHAADFQARMVIANALFFGRGRASRLVTPRVVYTSPELAAVGTTEGGDMITVPLSENDRSVLEGATDGFLRVHLKQGTDRILGVTIVAPHAGEMIGEAVLAMTNGIGLGAMGKAMHPYPTVAESYRKAADQWRRGKLTPWARRVLGWWFRAFG